MGRKKKSVFACNIVVTLLITKGYECDIAIKPVKLRNDSGTTGYGTLALVHPPAQNVKAEHTDKLFLAPQG